MLLMNVCGFMLIAVIVWWFWLYKPKTEKADEKDLVVVVDNGVYTPSRISLKTGNTGNITFLRKDASPCAEMLMIPELEISESLPVNKPKKIHLPKLKPGEYQFHCQMQMYKGVLQVQ